MSTANSQGLDTMFRVLADNRRRYVLYYFEETGVDVASLTDLTAQLVAWERSWDENDDHPKATHRDRLQTELHHTHLPRLADANLIEYDPRSETVRKRESAPLDQCVEANADELDRLFAVFNLSQPSP